MYDEKVKKIYFNESVQRLGQGLGILIYKNKGYDILTQAYNICNELHISKLISNLSDEYVRCTKKNLLNNEQVQELIGLLNDKKDAKIMADAIISYSRNFYTNKENKKVEGEK